MSLVSTLEEIVADAPDFVKLVQDGVAVEQAVAEKGIIAGFTQALAFQADLVNVFNDIMALGVAKAVAAGTVTPVAA